jgi:hypothetical protein
LPTERVPLQPCGTSNSEESLGALPFASLPVIPSKARNLSFYFLPAFLPLDSMPS